MLFLQDLAASIDERDVVKFTDVVKEFDSMSRLVRFSMTHWIVVPSQSQALSKVFLKKRFARSYATFNYVWIRSSPEATHWGSPWLCEHKSEPS